MILTAKDLRFVIVRMLAICLLAFSSVVIAKAQASRATPEPVLPGVDRRGDPDPMTTIEEEMRAKRAIRYAEKEYKDNLKRAHELADLGDELRESFKKNERLDHQDIKKLDRIEKLTKAIRNAAGGSENEQPTEKRSADLATALKQMLEVVDSLSQRVEETPRRVISAAVIDQANVLLELVRAVRLLSSKA